MLAIAAPGRRQETWLWGLVAVACATSLLGSVWAVTASSGCDACQAASELAGPLNLALLGVLFYTHLLLVMPARRARAYVVSGAFFASGVHLILVAILLRRHLVCPACYLTAAGAFAMAGLLLATEPSHRRRAFVIIPLAALLTVIARPLFRPASAAEVAQRKQIQLALDREASEPPVTAGKVRLLIYSRPTCVRCQVLDERILPGIRRELGDMLEIRYRPAWKGLRTPMLVVRGETRTHLVGLPTTEMLREAIGTCRARIPHTD
jgi:hypothetical protein